VTTVFIEPNVTAVLIESTETVALVERREIGVILEEGRQGPAGPSGANSTTLTTAEAIGGHRLVTTDASGLAIYADSSDVSHAGRVVGLSTGAASLGGTVTVQYGGSLTDPSFSYTPGDILYVGTNGLISTTPGTAFSQVIGYAEAATTIFIRIHQPILIV
jgi:hypothetical protein